MHPEIFSIGNFVISYYGLLVAIGVLVGLLIAQRLAFSAGIDGNKVFDLGIMLVIAAILGARLFYIILNWKDFLSSPMDYIFSRSGFVFLGGFIGALAFGIPYAIHKKLHLWDLADIFVTGLAFGHAVGRQGCLLNGCCYGKEICETSFFATRFMTIPGWHIPTQLFESMGEFIIFAILLIVFPKRKFKGENFIIYLIIYGILRFILEFFRGDYQHLFIWGLTFSQLIIIIFVPVMSGVYYILRKYGR